MNSRKQVKTNQRSSTGKKNTKFRRINDLYDYSQLTAYEEKKKLKEKLLKGAGSAAGSAAGTARPWSHRGRPACGRTWGICND